MTLNNYPLFCTVAQTGQVFDFHHRPGNVHDSNGAEDFIRACIREIREALPRALVEIRMDGAFFSQANETISARHVVVFHEGREAPKKPSSES